MPGPISKQVLIVLIKRGTEKEWDPDEPLPKRIAIDEEKSTTRNSNFRICHGIVSSIIHACVDRQFSVENRLSCEKRKNAQSDEREVLEYVESSSNMSIGTLKHQRNITRTPHVKKQKRSIERDSSLSEIDNSNSIKCVQEASNQETMHQNNDEYDFCNRYVVYSNAYFRNGKKLRR